MAPLPEDNTARYLIRYTSGGLPHVCQLRLDDSNPFTDITPYLESVVDAMLPIMATTDAVQSVDWIPQGTNISQPYPHDFSAAGVAGGTVDNAENRTAFLSLTGKDSNGHQVRVTFFNLIAGNFVDYRQPIGVVNPLIADWWAAVTATPVGPPVEALTVAGVRPYWKSYVNIGQNSHFQRKQR